MSRGQWTAETRRKYDAKRAAQAQEPKQPRLSQQARTVITRTTHLSRRAATSAEDGRFLYRHELRDGSGLMWPERNAGSERPGTDALRLILAAERRRRCQRPGMVTDVPATPAPAPAPARKKSKSYKRIRKPYRPTGTITAYAEELIRAVAYQKDGQDIGYDYNEIRAIILRKFPTVTKPGRHFGKPTQIPITDLHDMATRLNNRDGVKLPFRPRRPRDGNVRGHLAAIEPRDAFHSHQCEHCDRGFTPPSYGSDRGVRRAPKYCSNTCKQAAYRGRAA